MSPVGEWFKIYLFSETSGVVTMNGEPIDGVEVIRKAWIGFTDNPQKVYSDSMITGADGRFHFKAMTTRGVTPFFAATSNIQQKIILKLRGQEYVGWNFTKSYENHYELNTRPVLNGLPEDQMQPFDLQCELTAEDEIKTSDMMLSYATGICTWKGARPPIMPDSPFSD